VHGSQEAARKAEGNWIDTRAIHNINEAKAHQQHKYIRDKGASADQPKSMLLFGSRLSEEQEKSLLKFLFNNKDVLLGQSMIFVVSTKMLLSTLSI
jgi:hypothetical protein